MNTCAHYSITSTQWLRNFLKTSHNKKTLCKLNLAHLTGLPFSCYSVANSIDIECIGRGGDIIAILNS